MRKIAASLVFILFLCVACILLVRSRRPTVVEYRDADAHLSQFKVDRHSVPPSAFSLAHCPHYECDYGSYKVARATGIEDILACEDTTKDIMENDVRLVLSPDGTPRVRATDLGYGSMLSFIECLTMESGIKEEDWWISRCDHQDPEEGDVGGVEQTEQQQQQEEGEETDEARPDDQERNANAKPEAKLMAAYELGVSLGNYIQGLDEEMKESMRLASAAMHLEGIEPADMRPYLSEIRRDYRQLALDIKRQCLRALRGRGD